MKNKFLKYPLTPFSIGESDDSVSEVLKKLAETSYQGRQLGQVFQIYEKMLNDHVTIFFGLAGAMIPAGMRELLVYLIKNRFIDCIVSTGANLFHDCFESLGFKHFKGTPHINDVELRKERVDRIYDTFADDEELEKTDRYIMDFAESLDLSRNYTTREFFYLFGEKLSRDAKAEGIITSAYKSNVPIYCPAIADSSYGIALAILSEKKNKKIIFNVIDDIVETTKIVINSPAVGEFILGGGVPKNFIQQTEVTAFLLGVEVQGLKYAIQLTQDSPHWGGLSGCTFDEATSWGKVAFDAKKATAYVDSTIGFPLIVSAIAEVMKNKKRTPPLGFDLSRKELKIKKNSK